MSGAAGLSADRRRPAWAAWALGLAATAVALLYLWRIVAGTPATKDFAYFWLAGRIWLEGGDPYASSFSAAANALAAGAPGMEGLGGFHRWLYAPHVWGASVGLALLEFGPARALWGAASAAALALGNWLALRAVVDGRPPAMPALFGLLMLLSAGTLGTAQAVGTGQPAPFLYAAVAAFAHGALRRNPWTLGLGLLVLAMKPSLALPFVAFALAAPGLRRPALIVGAAALALALPAFVAAPPPTMAAGYLDGLAQYGTFESNVAVALTGLVNLAHHLAGVDVPGLAAAVAAAAFGAALGWGAWGRGGAGPAERGAGREALAALLAGALFLVALHLYDLALAVLLLVLLRPPGAGRPLLAALPWLAALGVNLALVRVNALSAALGLTDPATKFPGSFLASLLLLLLLLAALAAAGRAAAP